MTAALAHTKLCPRCLVSYGETTGYCLADGEELERLEDLLPPGTLVAGKFRVQGVLGFGGMGIVYLATQEDIERPVALKVPRREASREPGAEERFRRGARAASRIRDRRIVTIYDFGSTDEGLLYIAMERVSGQSLRDRMEPLGPDGERALAALPLEEALRIGRELAGALVAAHAAGVVHRDLKPENVMLTPLGPKILDFGIARIEPTGGVDQTTLTRKGALIGTARYISPEGAERKAIGPPADLYALGVMLHEMLTGARLFEEKVPELLIALHASMYPETIREVAPGAGFGEGLEELVERLLEKDPADRPTASEAEARLALLLEDPRAPRLLPRPEESGPMRLSSPGRSSPRLAVAVKPDATLVDAVAVSPSPRPSPRPAPSPSPPPPPQPAPTAAPSPPPPQPPWLVPTLAGGGLVILGLLAALLYFALRTSPPLEQATSVPPTLPASSSEPAQPELGAGAEGGEAAAAEGSSGAEEGAPSGEGAGEEAASAAASGSSAAAGGAGARPGLRTGSGRPPNARTPRPPAGRGPGLLLPPPPRR